MANSKAASKAPSAAFLASLTRVPVDAFPDPQAFRQLLQTLSIAVSMAPCKLPQRT